MSAPLRYTLRFPAPSTHYIDVEARVPTEGRADVELMMAVWTPGSYLVREYARNVEDVRAADPNGGPLATQKTRKNRWRIATGGAPEITVAYRVFAHEMSVRTNWVEDDFALVNGAPTFLTIADEASPRAHDVRIELPRGWTRAISALPGIDDDETHVVAPDFDTLVDSPIVCGTPAVYAFEVDDIPHLLVNVGEGGVWDGARSAGDVERIVRAARELWGALPYERYVFLNLLTETGGGLEHRDSTVLMASRWATRSERSYREWLGLVAHEHFHAWNVKRLRPVELGPFDYERENHTRSLWIAEGITEYYGELLVRRARLTTHEQYLAELSSNIRTLQTRPGRHVQSLETSSFDAWIKHYRPDENTANVTISYYGKGATIAALLDARIRSATNGARSLDDAMRIAYERYAGMHGFAREQFQEIAADVAGIDLHDFFRHALETTEELDYGPFVDWYGLRFAPLREEEPKAWLGITTRDDGGRIVVTGVSRDAPSYASGLAVDDELLAIDEYRVRAGQLETRLERYRPGDAITLLLARRDALRRVPLTLGAAPRETWMLEPRPDASAAQHARLIAWLGKP